MDHHAFQDRVVVVTGAASGIGEACARNFASLGARVVVADLNEASSRKVADVISGHAVKLDVTSADSVEAAAADIEAAVGPVDVLVTSAGVSIGRVPPEKMALPDWERIMEINLRGTWLCAVSFGSRMIKRGHGNIVTIASLSGMSSRPLHAYAPSKAAVINMTANLAAEWGHAGVRVNAVSPGFTLTPLLKGAIERGEKRVEGITDHTPLSRLIEPHEIAKAVAFLASDDASAITGINLPVDAGWLAGVAWASHGGVRSASKS
ncbi:MAG: SDR family oxidoreductase [Rhizobiaceae bacterium]|nr:SDR family oxidoreductase [Rhizobiaceae bacterium]